MGELLQARILDACPSPYGCAVFVGCPGKIFTIYVDRRRGECVKFALEGKNGDRPYTHEFFANTLDGLECSVKKVEIYHVVNGTFFTRMTVEMRNELGVKIVEIDGRPSDTFSVALRTGAPVFVDSSVADSVEDMTEAYEKIHGKF